MAEENDTLAEVKSTVVDSLLSVWGDFLERLPFLVAGIGVLILTGITVWIGGMIVSKILSGRGMRSSVKELIERFITLLIWSAGIMVAAMIVFPGLTPSKALGALGLLSVAIGLAFKDIFENFFAGILILWRFPFENGDFIECEGLTGKVEDVELRMTRIRKTTGELVVVPNAFLFKNAVEVLTESPKRRIHLPVGVSYDCDLEVAQREITDAIRSCESVASDKPVEVYAQNFGGSSIDFDACWWSAPKPADQRKAKGEVVTAIKKALDAAGIEIPFPQRTLTFPEPLTLTKDSSGQ